MYAYAAGLVSRWTAAISGAAA
ncbi:hypothetical protein CCACVL1_19271 [Corchorus capsularis]|uniref:Uncharacterized protein n=1 Tax=Corchorus capsularis TaxID=210143 RepID=A0A1R3HHK4_COCAP|nr:hypothetical protein CCACVL1_19271 [Corchorus capsularis]